MPASLKNALQLLALVATIGAAYAMPKLLEIFDLMQLTLFCSMGILALSLGFIWGFGGILCFGQTAFFGLGAYAYAIAAINFGDSTGAIALAILVPALFAAALGYFVFYGRISDVYLGVITLTVTLILFNVVNSTSGDQYRIGSARLGGFNGIPAVPTFNMPFDPGTMLDIDQAWYVTSGALIAVYLLLRLVLAFVIGGAVAGLGGALYVNWGAFVGPTIFSLSLSAEIIIWITVGGLGTLLGPVVGCFIIQYIVAKIGSQQAFNANLVLGAILIAFVLLLPQGLVPTLRDLILKAVRGTRDIMARRPDAGSTAIGAQTVGAE